jgi:hypothetical protein
MFLAFPISVIRVHQWSDFASPLPAIPAITAIPGDSPAPCKIKLHATQRRQL